MNKTIAARTKIYDRFQSSSSMKSQLSQAEQADAYAAYFTSMYLIQDTSESVLSICSEGFSSNPLRAYIELWGTFQALIIQQDAIVELNKAITGQQLSRQSTGAWQEIRTLRNELAGHPAAQGNKPPPKRSFFGRAFGNLDKITYEQFQSGSKPNGTDQDTQQLSINLRALIDRYDNEAATVLDSVLAHMKETWP
jgi:hypothetical protein